jgi:pimeloyl-ACP methyl ester carboxylesterase
MEPQIAENITGTDITIRLNDIITCYDDLGKSKTPIIFVHGFPFNKSTWQPQVDSLKKSHRVITYDIRGFGKSTIGKEKISIGLLADDLISFMDALKIKKAIVCGFSTGGYILLKAAYHYPQRFAALILSNTQCVADTFEKKEKHHQTIAKIKTGKLKEFTDNFIKEAFCSESLITKKDLVESARNTILSAAPLTVAATLAAIAERKEMCSGLSGIKVPALVICGKKDKITPPAIAEFLTGKLPNAKLRIIEKAGHLSNIERPDDFNQCIEDFIYSEIPIADETLKMSTHSSFA